MGTTSGNGPLNYHLASLRGATRLYEGPSGAESISLPRQAKVSGVQAALMLHSPVAGWSSILAWNKVKRGRELVRLQTRSGTLKTSQRSTKVFVDQSATAYPLSLSSLQALRIIGSSSHNVLVF